MLAEPRTYLRPARSRVQELHILQLMRHVLHSECAAVDRRPRATTGHCVRDYVHVSDLADAHVAALDWLAVEQPQLVIQSWK